mmetsp:Transcript_2677/g.10905  ORF Transcript_2677/g.10905 Transcript_2677/m.10905 type:complete len:299 (+) Transcript_2677:2892-3788(+)
MGRRGHRVVPLGRRINPGLRLWLGRILPPDSGSHRGFRPGALHRHGVLRRLARRDHLGRRRQGPGVEDRGISHPLGARIQAGISLRVVRRVPRRRSRQLCRRRVDVAPYRGSLRLEPGLEPGERDHRSGRPGRRDGRRTTRGARRRRRRGARGVPPSRRRGRRGEVLHPRGHRVVAQRPLRSRRGRAPRLHDRVAPAQVPRRLRAGVRRARPRGRAEPEGVRARRERVPARGLGASKDFVSGGGFRVFRHPRGAASLRGRRGRPPRRRGASLGDPAGYQRGVRHREGRRRIVLRESRG